MKRKEKPEEFTLEGVRYRVISKRIVTQYTDKGSFKFTVTIVEVIWGSELS